ncbi:MAG: response regulator transcription factor [Anaerolineales bacterium]|jgi:NarL family two-component system response regulator LiaR
MTEPISVILVDDHEMVRRGAAGFLQALGDIQVVAQAESGEEAIRLAGEHVPDVVLMDLVMPGLDGVETTRKLRQVSPHSQVIVLTSYFKDEYIFPALKAGAISYLLKDVKASELVDAVRRAACGEATLHPRVAARILREYRGVDPDAVNPYSELTEREMDVLKLIANGYTNQKIADELVITIGTVKGHVSNILSKLHLADRTEAAVFAWRQGIVRRGSE